MSEHVCGSKRTPRAGERTPLSWLNPVGSLPVRSLPAFLTSTGGCIVTGGVRLNHLLPHSLEEGKCVMPFSAFLTCTDCCTVADSIHCHSRLALFQEHQGKFPTLALLASADGCTVASRISLNSLLPHCLQKNKCLLPFRAFLTRADCCAVADSTHCRPSLALFQELQRLPFSQALMAAL